VPQPSPSISCSPSMRGMINRSHPPMPLRDTIPYHNLLIQRAFFSLRLAQLMQVAAFVTRGSISRAQNDLLYCPHHIPFYGLTIRQRLTLILSEILRWRPSFWVAEFDLSQHENLSQARVRLRLSKLPHFRPVS